MSANTPDLDGRPDETQDLIRRHRAGDRDALNTLFERYYPRVVDFVRIKCGKALLAVEEAEDVVQHVFLRILQGLESYEARGDTRWIVWVATLAHNVIKNRVRHHGAEVRGGDLAERVRKAAHSSILRALPDDTTGVASKVATREEEEILKSLVAKLSPSHRDVILYRHYAGGDWETVAELLGSPSVKACQERYRRARQALARAHDH
jgi:RNA polymerase sigma-70 factor, ECF subfamily